MKTKTDLYRDELVATYRDHVHWIKNGYGAEHRNPRTIRSVNLAHLTTDRSRAAYRDRLLLIPRTGFSHSSGGTVHRSNFESLAAYFRKLGRLLENDHGDIVVLSAHGRHKTRQLVVNIDAADDELLSELLNILQDLDAYPLFDDEHHARLEQRLTQKAWNDWGRETFRRHLALYAPDLDRYEPDPAALDDLFWTVFYDLGGHTSVEQAFGDVYFEPPIEDVAAAATTAPLRPEFYGLFPRDYDHGFTRCSYAPGQLEFGIVWLSVRDPWIGGPRW